MQRALSVLLVGMSFVFGYSIPAVGQTSGLEELVTDRPDFTESGVVVPRGSFQVEGGLTWERSAHDIRTASGPELLIRWGFMRQMELRIGLPNYVDLRNHENDSGFGDSSIGTKLELGPIGGEWDLAGIVSVSLPTGGAGFSSDDWDRAVIIATARGLGGSWSLGSQVFAESATRVGDREFFWGGTVVFGASLGSQSATGAFLELAATFPEEGVASVSIHHGYTHLLTKTLQLDIHGGAGLTESAPDLFIGAGTSFRR